MRLQVLDLIAIRFVHGCLPLSLRHLAEKVADFFSEHLFLRQVRDLERLSVVGRLTQGYHGLVVVICSQLRRIALSDQVIDELIATHKWSASL